MSFPWISDSQNLIKVSPLDLLFDQQLFKIMSNLGVDFGGLLLLFYKVKFINFDVFGILSF